jgi:hypothetical protein
MGGWVDPRAGLDWCGETAPPPPPRSNRDSIPYRSAHSEPLHRLHYPGPPKADSHIPCRSLAVLKADSHIACRSPAVLRPIHTSHAVFKAESHIPCRSHAVLKADSHIPCRSPAVALRGRFQNGIFVAWQGNGMVGKRHRMCESAPTEIINFFKKRNYLFDFLNLAQ